MKLDYFANDKAKVLMYLLSISSITKGEYYFQKNQQDLADEVHFSKQKTNGIMQDLQENGFIELLTKNRGTYHLTKKAVKALHYFEKEI